MAMAMVVTVVAVAAIVSVPAPVRGRHGRQEGESEGCRERRKPEAPARCVSVTQEIPPHSVIGRGASPSARHTVRETNIRRSI